MTRDACVIATADDQRSMDGVMKGGEGGALSHRL